MHAFSKRTRLFCYAVFPLSAILGLTGCGSSDNDNNNNNTNEKPANTDLFHHLQGKMGFCRGDLSTTASPQSVLPLLLLLYRQ